MKVAIYGLGNVGLVAAACLAELGHNVVGVEKSLEKVHQLNQDDLYIFESGLRELLSSNKSKLKFVSDYSQTKDSEIYIICVGTPTAIDGAVITNQVEETIDQILSLGCDEKTTIMLRSTVPPRTCEKIVFPKLEKAKFDGKFLYHPEFLREGSAVEDFFNPHLHIVGTNIDSSIEETMNKIYPDHPYRKVDINTAEMIKYYNNSFHALKIAFSNEVASIAIRYGVNPEELTDVFLSDTKLNISEKYLKPGCAYGGPCLTKDLKALENLSSEAKVKTPLLDSIDKSNQAHLERSLKKISNMEYESILFCGLSFKEGTNDLRSSPMVSLVQSLKPTRSYIQKKIIYIYDPRISTKEVENLNVKLVDTLDEVINSIDLIVLGSHSLKEDESKLVQASEIQLIDLGFSQPFVDDTFKVVRSYE